ncbi:MAG: DUF975 family protein [Lentisphaeria bacterium]|nr:DUF975 family protein [Lentisphaeria bacterium]
MSHEIISPGSTFGQLSNQVWTALRGKWGTAVGAFFIAQLILCAASQFGGALAGILLAPLNFGVALISLRFLRNEPASDLGILFEPFSQYGRCVWGVLRPSIFIILWYLLLIVPGIIASIRYSQTIFILLDRPDLSVKEAMEESCRIMYGHKLHFFGLSLLLALIAIPVAVCTLFIGLLWLVPWMGVFWAAFYESIKRPVAVIAEDGPAETPSAEPPVQA